MDLPTAAAAILEVLFVLSLLILSLLLVLTIGYYTLYLWQKSNLRPHLIFSSSSSSCSHSQLSQTSSSSSKSSSSVSRFSIREITPNLFLLGTLYTISALAGLWFTLFVTEMSRIGGRGEETMYNVLPEVLARCVCGVLLAWVGIHAVVVGGYWALWGLVCVVRRMVGGEGHGFRDAEKGGLYERVDEVEHEDEHEDKDVHGDVKWDGVSEKVV